LIVVAVVIVIELTPKEESSLTFPIFVLFAIFVAKTSCLLSRFPIDDDNNHEDDEDGEHQL
jgi:hypothetical protein